MISTDKIGPLAVSVAGEPEASPLVFLHGIGSSRRAFADQLTYFGTSRWCLAPDAPGYADSDDDPAIESLDDFVGHVLGLLNAVEAADADIVGVSWGGVIAARLAASHPDRVRRLVLADTSRGSGRSTESAEAMRGRADALKKQGATALARARSPRLLSPDAPSALLDAVANDMAAAIRLPGYGQAAASMADTDHTKLLATITVPTLVVVGDADVICPLSEAEFLTGLIPGASLEVIQGAGHLANREQPAAFNQVVEQFLSSAS